MKNEKLARALGNCINACNYCAYECLKENDVQEMVNCMRMNHICAEVCTTLNQLLATDYEDIKGLVEYCIKTCKACAEECEKHKHQHCQDCAKACRECAKACEAYLA